MSLLTPKIKYSVVVFLTIAAMVLSYIVYNNYQLQKKFEKSHELFKSHDSIDVVRLMPLAEEGHGMSNVLMGAYHLKLKDTLSALKYFNTAVDNGEEIYGSFGISISSNRAVFDSWLNENATSIHELAKNGDWYWQKKVADFIVAGIMPNNKNKEEAFNLMKESCNQGYVRAQAELGNYYFQGIGTKKDTKQAAACFVGASNNGNAEATYMVGYCLEKGIECEISYSDALDYYKIAAKKGIDKAQYRLALCYKNGWGTSVDITEAMKWAKLSAANGNVDAAAMVLNYSIEEEARKNVAAAKSDYQYQPEDNSSNSGNACEWCGNSYSNLGFYYNRGEVRENSDFIESQRNSIFARGYHFFCSRRCATQYSWNN